MDVCRELVGGALIRVVSRSRENGFLRNHYLLVSHSDAPTVTAMRFIGEDQGQAVRRFELSCENAMAVAAFEEIV
jgi:hypothetical protein